MKKILLASVGVMVMSAGMAYAACIPTPSCASLGYESSSSCEGGIKCPFGNAWNCTLTDIKNKITELEKIIEESVGGNKNCAVGHIYYSDKSCSVSYDASKTPIGVVVYVDGQGHGQVMALKSIGSYKWSNENVDLGLSNFDSDQTASTDHLSCTNTAIITAAGDKNKYPAAWAAKEYSTEGTKAGDWCLPAAGIMTSIKNNMSAINAGFILTGGIQIGENSDYWSSSEKRSYTAWPSSFSREYGLYYTTSTTSLGSQINNYGDDKDESYEVRPVLEF